MLLLDKDSSLRSALLKYFPNCHIIYCGGHMAKNHRKHLQALQKKKRFYEAQRQKYAEMFPSADPNVKCHCAKRCCLTDHFIRKAGFDCLSKAGTNPDSFSTRYLSCYWYSQVEGRAM